MNTLLGHSALGPFPNRVLLGYSALKKVRKLFPLLSTPTLGTFKRIGRPPRRLYTAGKCCVSSTIVSIAVCMMIIGFMTTVILLDEEYPVDQEDGIWAASYDANTAGGPRVVGFYHIAQLGHWSYIVDTQIESLESSGLLDRTSVVNVIVLGNITFESEMLKFRTTQMDNLTQWEFPTLDLLRSHCSLYPNDLVWYIHNKGASRTPNRPVEDWRKLLMYFVVERWQDCYTHVANNETDACGSMLYHNTDLDRFYAGNFWWARCDYINTLPAYNRADRYSAERWVGQGNVRLVNCYQTCTHPYFSAYPPERYKDSNCSGPLEHLTPDYSCRFAGIQLNRGFYTLSATKPADSSEGGAVPLSEVADEEGKSSSSSSSSAESDEIIQFSSKEGLVFSKKDKDSILMTTSSSQKGSSSIIKD
mmetsp:Transcript_38891/g.62996  ORF Transcript_38891/g.62996 Transcript_38891/m.62996 type:complete len:418 (-) Transcript_38891:561-1814(-)